MNAVIIEHVRVGDLPETWRIKVSASQETWVTIRIETEPTAPVVNADDSAEDSLFGMWRDRDNMTDPEFEEQVTAARGVMKRYKNALKELAK